MNLKTKVKKIKEEPKKKKKKINSVKTEYNGVLYDSKVESRFAELLDTLNIKFTPHVKYQVIPKIAMKNGSTSRASHYIADFVLEDGTVIDIKGFMVTAEFKLKTKLMKLIHDIGVVLLVECPKALRESIGIEKYNYQFTEHKTLYGGKKK